MVVQAYDIFDRQEKPAITLCNPNKTQLHSLKMSTETIVKWRYNTVSEISFSFPKEFNDVDLPAYPLLVQKRLVNVDGLGYFVISDVSENAEADVPTKKVRALSLEFTLMGKKLTAFGGQYLFYDPLGLEESLMDAILAYIPNWSIGAIDSELYAKYRTFDVADTNIYNFLMSDVADAFGCIFTFDTDLREISATVVANATTSTDVYFSRQNVIDSYEFREIADELTTALYVYGGGDLDIRTVNPLGTSIIYNFDYYKTTEWMSQGLITNLTAWEALIVANLTTYANTLSELKTALGDLVVLNSELVDLNTDYLVEEGLKIVRIEAGLSYADINLALAVIQEDIDNKEAEIVNMEASITSLRAILTGINDDLSFDNNFTTAQLSELDTFMYENTYQNENLLQLDSMDSDDVQDLAQELYDQGVEVLERISQPRYEFSMDTVSVLALKEYEEFSDNLDLGSIVYVESDDGEVLELVLLEMVFDYDNPDGFEIVFSNRLRLDNGAFVFSDLFGSPVKTGATVKFDKIKWGSWENQGYKNEVTSFIDSSLDASTNNLVNGDNEEIKIYSNGLRARHWDTVLESYDPRELWLTSNAIAFSNDNFTTSEMAIGQVNFNGVPLYGVVADAIVGRIIAGNTLVIQNNVDDEVATFKVDGQGATLVNADFTITNLKNQIILSPTDGIKVQKLESSVWVDKFFVDGTGDIIFAGNLQGATGTFSGSITANSGSIGGMSITANGIDVDANHFIHNNGDITWGGLTISGTNASFDGTISASELSGDVQWSQIVNAPLPASRFDNTGSTNYSANGLKSGTMSGVNRSGGVITWSGVQVYTSGYGEHFIVAESFLNLQSPGVGINGQLVVAGFVSATGGLGFNGDLYANGTAGISKYVYYQDWSSVNRYMRFTNGVLTFAS